MRYEEAAVRAPRVHAEAALTAHSRQISSVKDLEHKAEAVFQFALPLLDHRRGSCNHNGLRFFAEKQLTGDQASFDRFAKAGVVSDKEIHARQTERLAEWLHLVGI